MDTDNLIVIGENFNSTHKIKATSPRVVEEDGKTGIMYNDLDGNKRMLDCTDIIPKDPSGLSWGGEFLEAGGLNLRVSLRKELLNQAGQAQFQKSYEEHRNLSLCQPCGR